MLTRNGQPIQPDRQMVPGYGGRLTQDESEAYGAVFRSIEPEFAEMREIQKQLHAVRRSPLDRKNSGSVKVAGKELPLLSTLLKLPKSEILLCGERGNFAIVRRFDKGAAFSRCNGGAEVLSTGTSWHSLTQQYSEQAQHTLRFMASNLVAKAQKIAFEQYPTRNPSRVMDAISDRCAVAVGIHQSLDYTQQNRQSKGVRI